MPFLRLLSSYAVKRCAALVVLGCVAACGKDAAAPAATVVAPISVRTLTVEPRKVPIRFDVVGQVEGSKQVEVRARVSGILQKQFYKEGDAVKEGAPLFQIDRAPFEIALAQARAQLAQATAQVDQARREEARLKPLVEDRAVSRKEYDDATSARQLAEAAMQQANAAIRQAELNLSYTRVTAPVAGITGRAEHSVGTLITTDANGSLLTTINQVTPIWVRFSLAEVGSGQDSRRTPESAATPVEVQLLLPDGSPYPARAGSISPPPRSTHGSARSSCAPSSTIRASSCCRGSSSRSASPPASATTSSSCRRPP